MRWAYQALVINEFSGLSFSCAPGESGCVTNGSTIIRRLGFEGRSSFFKKNFLSSFFFWFSLWVWIWYLRCEYTVFCHLFLNVPFYRRFYCCKCGNSDWHVCRIPDYWISVASLFEQAEKSWRLRTLRGGKTYFLWWFCFLAFSIPFIAECICSSLSFSASSSLFILFRMNTETNPLSHTSVISPYKNIHTPS